MQASTINDYGSESFLTQIGEATGEIERFQILKFVSPTTYGSDGRDIRCNMGNGFLFCGLYPSSRYLAALKVTIPNLCKLFKST